MQDSNLTKPDEAPAEDAGGASGFSTSSSKSRPVDGQPSGGTPIPAESREVTEVCGREVPAEHVHLSEREERWPVPAAEPDPAYAAQGYPHEAPIRDIVRGYGITPLSGKRPLRSGWQVDPECSGLDWLESGHQGNHGIVLQDTDRVLLVDVDVKGGKDGTEAFQALANAANLDAGRFLMQRTPSGGFHLLGRIPEGYPAGRLPNGSARSGLDVLRDRKQFVRAPGFTDGGEYKEVQPLPPLDLRREEHDDPEKLDLPDWPVEFLDLLASESGNGSTPPPSQEELRAPSVDWVREAVRKIDNDDRFPSRDDWITVAYAIRAAVGPENVEEGHQIFREFSERWEGGNNTPDEIEKAYRTANPADGYRVGFSYLADLAGDTVAVAQDTFEANPDAEPPEESEPTDQAAKPTASYTLLSDVEPEAVRWLWPGRIPLGKVTVFDGDPDMGKSTVTLDLAARITTGCDMPDGGAGLDGPAGVVFVSAEDDVGDTVRPRLDVAGGDAGRVAHLYRITEKGRDRFIRVQDAKTIEEVVRELNAKLVVVDPLMAFLGTKDQADSYRDQDVRSALLPISDMAKRTGAAVVLIRHLTKQRSGKAILAGGGSMGIIGAARAGFLVAEHPKVPTLRVLAPTKHNLSRLPSSLAFRTEGVEHPSTGDSVPRIAWQGVTKVTANELVSSGGDRKTPALDEARTFLDALLSNGPKPVKEIRQATTDAGLSFRTVRRAKGAMGISAHREGGLASGGGWVWELPPSLDAETAADLSDVQDEEID